MTTLYYFFLSPYLYSHSKIGKIRYDNVKVSSDNQLNTKLCLPVKELRYILTLSGEVTLPFTYLHGFTLKGKNLLVLEQILSFKSKSQFERAMSARKANRKSQKLFLYVKMTEKHRYVPIHLK